MNKVFIISVLFAVSFAVASFGQTSSDSITIKKSFLGTRFYQGEKELKMSQLSHVMKSSPMALKQIKKARTTYVMASIVGGIGGGLVGWPIGTALGGGEANWTLAGIGAGLIAISIPIIMRSEKQAKRAVDMFNKGAKNEHSFWDDKELKFGLTGSGVSLAFTF